MNRNVKITLNPGREGSVLRRHPWIFSGAVKNVEGSPENGQTVEVFASDGRWLARGSYSEKSQIRIRLLTFDPEEIIDSGFFRKKIEQACGLRERLPGIDSAGAYRLIYSESDGLPGLIVDRYGDFLVCQFLSAGAEYWKEEIVNQLKEMIPCRGIYERSDTDSRQKEGLSERTGLLYGDTPPPLIEIWEDGRRFLADILKGHKTGFYLDQRINRGVLQKYSEGKEVLNAFSYTGGFGIAASLGGAIRVVNADTSADALELAERNFRLNDLPTGMVGFVTEDVFNLLRTYRDSRQQFDLVVLDPPKFVSSAGQLDGGTRGYKDINLLAFKLLRPGGMLITFSCSGYVKPDLFQKIVADAALDAGRDARALEFLSQAPDHPVALNFPEALYLKGLVVRVV